MVAHALATAGLFVRGNTTALLLSDTTFAGIGLPTKPSHAGILAEGTITGSGLIGSAIYGFNHGMIEPNGNTQTQPPFTTLFETCVQSSSPPCPQ